MEWMNGVFVWYKMTVIMNWPLFWNICFDQDEHRSASICESTASTVTAASDIEMSSDDGPDSDGGSDTTSVPTPDKLMGE